MVQSISTSQSCDKKTVNLKLKLGYSGFLNKIKIFERDILSKTVSFPNIRMRMNALHTKTIADHKVEEYQNVLQDYWRSSKPDLIICASKTMLCILCKYVQC